jgi:hypothetical protein
MYLRHTWLEPIVRSAALLLCITHLASAADDSRSPKITFVADLLPGFIRLTWTNVSSHSCLLNLGTVWAEQPLFALGISVNSGNGDMPASIANVSGVLNGRADPWVLFMPAQSEFRARVPLASIRINKSGMRVASLSGPYDIKISYEGRPATDFAPGGKAVPFSLSRSGPTNVPACRFVCCACQEPGKVTRPRGKIGERLRKKDQ